MEKNIALKKQIANQSKEIEVLKTREMSDIPPLVPKAGFQSDAPSSIYDWISGGERHFWNCSKLEASVDPTIDSAEEAENENLKLKIKEIEGKDSRPSLS